MHVEDTTPPTVTSAGQQVACLWPPNHWYVPVHVEDLHVSVTDDCSNPVTWQVKGCVSDQPDDASLWELTPHRTELGALSPGSLVETIRRPATGG